MSHFHLFFFSFLSIKQMNYSFYCFWHVIFFIFCIFQYSVWQNLRLRKIFFSQQKLKITIKEAAYVFCFSIPLWQCYQHRRHNLWRYYSHHNQHYYIHHNRPYYHFHYHCYYHHQAHHFHLQPHNHYHHITITITTIARTITLATTIIYN